MEYRCQDTIYIQHETALLVTCDESLFANILLMVNAETRKIVKKYVSTD